MPPLSEEEKGVSILKLKGGWEMGLKVGSFWCEPIRFGDPLSMLHSTHLCTHPVVLQWLHT